MALFRKFFYRKPPEGLLEITERVYVFDCCFTTNALRDEEYEEYIGCIVDQLRDYFPDGAFAVFSFGDEDYQTEMSRVLSKHDIAVAEYPRHYGNCPVLTVEQIHGFLKNSDKWLGKWQRNVLLMHCQNGAFPVLAFMLSAFLIFGKLYTGEKKTLDMVYKQAPQGVLHMVSPIDPLPSQLRYLQYVSRRNLGSRWPPLDRALTLDCVILRDIPDIDGNGGCRPIFRVYGPDPLMGGDPHSKLLFCMPKTSKAVGYFRQADCEFVKIDINCHVQGDVVIECICLSDDLDDEEMMFRAMFNTAFVRSNMVILNRDEIDALWNVKDLFPQGFRAEVLFSDLDSTSAFVMLGDSPVSSDIEGLPIDAFAQVHDIFNDLDWGDTDFFDSIIQDMNVSRVLDFTGFPSSGNDSWQNVGELEDDVDDVGESLRGSGAVSGELLENEATSPPVGLTEMLTASLKASLDSVTSAAKKVDPTELRVSVQRPAQSKIISPSNQGSPYASSSQGSPVTLTRYHSAPVSAVGITALLQDHADEGVAAAPPPPPPPPPAPPSHSTSESSVSPQPPTIGTSKPPPPPPPPSSSNATIVQTSPKPIPPPPTPLQGMTPPPPPPPQLAKGVPPPPAPSSKPGGISSACSVLGVKGKLQLRTGIKAPKKSSLKPYHWLKLTRAMQGSLWAEAQKPEEASKAPELDLSELESLFSAAVPNPAGRKTSMRGSAVKTDKVHLIELRRAYNCEIMLTKVKIPVSDLMDSVLALDDSALDADQVENLIKFCPTKEEIELLKNYNGDKENLGKCEQFFMELMNVPRVEAKLRVFSFKIQFSSQVSDLKKSLHIVNSISEEVRNSVKLKRIMQTILSLGNALNQGTARGSAVGFRLDSLPKLAETRARNNKLTLIHYLCKVIADKLPEVLDFHEDLENLEPATKIQLKYLAEEMQAINKGIEKVVQELTASENDGLVSDSFCKILKNFLGSAESEVRSLASLYSGVGRNADALAHYFGEDPARCPFEQVVSTLLSFVRMFQRAHEENCKKLELEKKKAAQEETENQKAKQNASNNENEVENAAKLPGLETQL